MFRHATEWGDHILHVEWRFTKLEGERPYNSGIYVRTGADGAIGTRRRPARPAVSCSGTRWSTANRSV